MSSSISLTSTPALQWSFNSNVTEAITGLVFVPGSNVNTSFITGLNGQQALKFNNSLTPGTAATSYIKWIPPATLSSAAMTITLWVNPTSFSTTSNTEILSMAKTNAQGDIRLSMGNTATNLTYIQATITGNNAASGASLAAQNRSSGTWMHLAMTLSEIATPATSVFSFYINGAFFNSYSWSTSPGPRTFNNIVLGAFADISPIYMDAYNGLVSDLRFYNSVLGAIQINSIYSNQSAPTNPQSFTNTTTGKLVFNVTFDNTSNDIIGGLQPVNPGQQYPSGTNITQCNVVFNTVTPKIGTASGIFSNVLGTPYSLTFLQYNQAIDVCASGYTCATWAKFYSLPASTQQSVLYTRGTAQFQGQVRLYAYGTTPFANYWNGISAGGASSASVSGTAISSNVWNHYAITINPSGIFSFYINGISQSGSGTNCQPRQLGITYSQMQALFVGAQANNNTYTLPINGEIDDVRVYNYALSSNQVYNIYNAITPTSLANLSPISSPLTFSGQSLFAQLTPATVSSAVGAFSLRAVNGVTAKAVQVVPGGTFPPSAMTQTGTNSSTQTLGTGKLQGSYIASSSTSAFTWGAPGAFTLKNTGTGPDIWQVNSYPAGGGTVATPTTTTTGATNYNGEWLQFQTPFPINLTGYSASTGFLTSVVLLGSTTGAASSWILIDSKLGITVFSTISNTGLNFAGYSYFRFVVITSTTSYPVLANVQFNGTIPSLAQDFYADRLGNLLTVPITGQTLSNWLGGAKGYIATWYDQSGAGNHASQATAANQPQIQKATKGPGYMILFSGNQYLTGFSYTVLNNTNYTMNCIERRGVNNGVSELPVITSGNVGGNGKVLSLLYNTNTKFSHSQWGPEPTYSYGATVLAYAGSGESIRYWTADFSQVSKEHLYLNGSLFATNSTQFAPLASTGGNFNIGNYPSSSSYYTGEMYEILIFTKSLYDIDTSGGLITQIYNNQLSYTGT
jgi:hypothetical protein